MNRPTTRAPAPPPAGAQQTQYAERHEDATFNEIAAESPANNLPARAEPVQINRTPVTAKGYSERAEEPTEALPESGPGAVIASIAAIMAELKPVAKSGWNDFHKYNYARMQDLSAELTPLMGKHGIVVFQTEEGRELFDNGAVLAVRYRFTVVHKSGAIWPQRPIVTGVSAAKNRGGFDDKALNKCHTAARKYFLLSLFQIASADDEDADGAGPAGETAQARPRPQGAQRRAPSPDGKVKPHTLPVVTMENGEGETPESWATRFNAFVEKAKTADEIDDWYNANAVIFEKLKRANEAVYNDVVAYMDTCTERLAKPAASEKMADPISTGPTNGADAGKPAEKTFSELWLEELENRIATCDDTDSIEALRVEKLFPMKGKVSGVAWNTAIDLFNDSFERVKEG